jgi:hypothetical protein
MPEIAHEEEARVAYNAYANSLQWVQSPQGTAMVRWEALRDDYRQAWSMVIQMLKEKAERDAAAHEVQQQQQERNASQQSQAGHPSTVGAARG